jgi:hypothetical protein
MGGQSNCTIWDTATSTQCQVYVANWSDASISLDVNLPTGTTNGLDYSLSPVSDMSPWTFFPNTGNTTTQACPVANQDILKITVANAQGGGTSAAICVLVGTSGSQNCPAWIP